MKKKFIYEKEVPLSKTEIKIGFPLIKKIYSGKSKYQEIDIVELDFWGKTLFLDKILQTCEKDEFVYHEMITHFPLFSCDKPKKVLIIGGGDGGVLKQALKHKSVDQVLMIELDNKVVELCQKHLLEISGNAFKDKRSKVIIDDGQKIIDNYTNYFDVIILDLPDPYENCKNLISVDFYKKIKKALIKNGTVSVQSGSFTSQIELVSMINKRLKKVFKFVEPIRVCVPSYQAGEFSLTMASDFNFKNIEVKELKKKSEKMKFKYWSPEVHLASMVIPKYIHNELKK